MGTLIAILDSHAHMLEYGFTKLLPIEGTRTVKGEFSSTKITWQILTFCVETVKRVRKYIESHPDLLHNKTILIEGWGWDHTKWTQTVWPTAVRIFLR